MVQDPRKAPGLGTMALVVGTAISACAPPPEPPSGGPAGEGSGEERAGAESEPPLPGISGSAALRSELDTAVKAKGTAYRPRTQHLDEDGSAVYVNRLILESSPYLLQHAHNPVNWHAWGDDAFEKARRLGRPVLLSIGYSTCHWCHVMERESFEDEEIAAFINTHYVAIKVDREQRPDVDEVYMSAVQMMTGQGGWPMTVVLTPDRQPFFAGTYFPARDGDRGARKGFATILEELALDYQESPDEVLAHAQEVSRRIAAASAPRGPTGLADARAIEAAVDHLAASYDPRWGGFGSAPKFPRPAELELLLRWARRSGDAEATRHALGTLDGMINGGIHDHVGGGFHRYSTDPQWLVPHFEKMLYDNAQLVVALVEAWQVGGDERYAGVARETLDYLMREMSSPQGGFYSATDADSPVPGREGKDGDQESEEEGWYFTWGEEELAQTLTKEEAEAVRTRFATTARGNFEGRNILHTPRDASEAARALGIPLSELEARIATALPKLREVRSRRPPPLRDDKILASWNGLTLSALARTGFALAEDRYLERARQLAGFLLDQMRDPQGRLLRSVKDERASGRGYLDDYAFVIQGLIDLYEADGDPRWLAAALDLQRLQDEHYLDAQVGGYFTSAHDAEALLARQKPDYDGAEPSGNSVAATNLLRLHQLTGQEPLRARGLQVLTTFSLRLTRAPASVPKMLGALDFALDRPLQIYLVAPAGQTPEPALLEVLRRTYVPNHAIVLASESQLAEHLEWVPGSEGKAAMGGRTTAYVCEANVCQRPTSDPREFAEQLRAARPYEAATPSTGPRSR